MVINKERINKAHLREFVEALESGRYKQTKECLRDANGYCAGGVACDVSGVGVWVAVLGGWWYQDPTGWRSEFTTTSPLVDRWYGCAVALLPVGHDDLSVVAANDCGWSFAEIAEALRERYLDEPVVSEGLT
jgi:hypothetical protein